MRNILETFSFNLNLSHTMHAGVNSCYHMAEEESKPALRIEHMPFSVILFQRHLVTEMRICR